MRDKTRFFCTQCGQESLKWVGKCPGCSEWNTMVEELVSRKTSAPRAVLARHPILLKDVKAESLSRIPVGSPELDRVLGGGLVPGSVVLVGGDPGIGKSTLLLQTAEAIASIGKRVLYFSGEESLEQMRLRASRLGVDSNELYVAAETDVNILIEQAQGLNPAVVIIDSIQTVYSGDLSSAPGSVGQVRDCAGRLIRLAKDTGIAVFLIGHVTKEGAIAGPRILEHMVDAVLYFEGERHLSFRLLRAVKNRFGSTNEVGVFQMESGGLKDVDNPSELLLTERPTDVAGSIVVPLMEGTRPMLIEIQALLAPASYGNPRRTTSGVEGNRVAMVLAVLERRVGFDISFQDSYVNAVGGIRVSDPAADLAIAICLASSLRNAKIPRDVAVVGEVGLTGEVRGVSRIDVRAAEVKKLGFKRLIVPKSNGIELTRLSNKPEIFPVQSLHEALQATWNM
ncbi:MAG: DNA repair protein RadA [Peptococcaceae bacterium]|nr:DNA repair protein RadA [Peptococcaceae bacterium]